jgi:DTW domain-containing protein
MGLVLRQRAPCLRCFKPQSTCYCAQLRPFESRVKFVLLQHPSERRKAIGTARMTHLSLPGSLLIVGRTFDTDLQVNALIADPRYHCVSLFPGPGSQDLGEAGGLSTFPAGKIPVVFVLDATWPLAKKMLFRSPNLVALPRICFTPEHESEYLIRRQPHPYCLSTLEAVHRTMTFMDPEADSGRLLTLFRSMVQMQAGYGPPVPPLLPLLNKERR